MNKQIIKDLIGNKNEIVLFELGAADGTDTLEFVNIFNDRNFKYYAFEPDIRNIQSFREKIKDERVNLLEYAVGNENGIKKFYASTKSKQGDELIYSSSLREPGKKLFEIWKQFEDGFEKQFIYTVSLDDFVENYGIKYIDFLFMDVQGCEDLVIEGGRNTFKDKIHFLYTEYSNNEIYVGEKNLTYILSMLPGYSVIQVYPNVNGDLEGGDILLVNTLFEENQKIVSL